MMNNGPRATIGRILDIEWPRPRDRVAFMESPVYTHYRTECMRFLFWRHGKQAAAAAPAAEPTAPVAAPRIASALSGAST
jgi:nitrate/nitrite transport system ATP-binding protein